MSTRKRKRELRRLRKELEEIEVPEKMAARFSPYRGAPPPGKENEDGIWAQKGPVEFVEEQIGVGKAPDEEGVASYQKEVLRSCVENKRVAWRASHGAGKCVSANDLVRLHDGRWVQASDLIGKHFVVTSVNDKLEYEPDIAWAEDNGVKPVYEIITSSGRRVLRTPNHPLRTWSGWTIVSELSVGDDIAVPLAYPSPQPKNSPLSRHEAKLLGYMIGDGSCVSGTPSFTNCRDEMLDDFQQAAEKFGSRPTRRHCEEDTYEIRVNSEVKHAENSFRKFLEKHGVYGKYSYQKRIPQAVFESDDDIVSTFIERLWACDGWIIIPPPSSNNMQLAYSSSSRDLAEDLQRLLLRFGIVSRIRRKKTTHRDSYNVVISRAEDVLKFYENIGTFGRKEYWEANDGIDYVKRRAEGVNWSKTKLLPKKALGEYEEDRKQKNKTLSEVWGDNKYASRARHKMKRAQEALGRDDVPPDYIGFEEITEINYLGEQDTVAISVAKNQTFVSEVIDHNSTVLSWVILWYLLTRPFSRVLIVAPAFERQVGRYLLSEVRKWARHAEQWGAGKLPINVRADTVEVKGHGREWYALGVQASDPSKVEGGHAESIAILADEAKGLDDEVVQALHGTQTDPGGDRLYFLCSVPGAPSGPFYKIFRDGGDIWDLHHTSALEAVEEGRVSQEWVEERKSEWGEHSPVFKSRVLGEFPEEEEGQLYHMSDIEYAMKNTVEHQADDDEDGRPPVRIGVDVARYGNDRSAAAVWVGNECKEIQTWQGMSTTRLASGVGSLANRYKADRIIVDEQGVGGGVIDRLEQMGYANVTYGEMMGTNANEHEIYADRKSEVFWKFRELLEKEEVSLPEENDKLMAELLAFKYEYTRNDRIKLEFKDKIRKRLGRSPDIADAVVLGAPRDDGQNWIFAIGGDVI